MPLSAMRLFNRPDQQKTSRGRVATWVGAAAGLCMGLALFFGAFTSAFPMAGDAAAPVLAGLLMCLLSAAMVLWLRRTKRALAALTAEADACRKAQNEANDAREAASRALAVAAHEIRTPMSGIIGMLDLLLETPLSAEQRNYAKTAAASARALLSVTTELLDAPEHAGNGDTPARDRFDPAGLAESITELLAPRAHAKGIEISCFVSDQLPAALAGDERRLRQVLLNLCGNAIKFTEAGGVALEFHRVGETKLRIAVSDTGIGLTEDEQQRIFEEFVQANGDTRRLFGGSGMGLAICRRLVDAMGGDISVRSAPGAGSVFEVILPLGERLLAPAAEAPSGRVLVLAAQPSIAAHHLQLMLEEKGVKVRRIVKIEDFAAALSGAQPALPNEIICDAAFASILRQSSAPDVCAPASRITLMLRPEERAQFVDLLTAPRMTCLLKPVRRAAVHRLLKGEIDTNAFPVAPHLQNLADGLASPRQRTVILAEDDAVNALLARNILERQGWRVRQARTGREVLDLLKTEGRPDLLLMDIGMPVLDGLETSRLIRQHEAETSLPRLPILALTARVRERDLAECLAAGMDGHLAKPFDRSDLDAALARLDARRAAA